jgi:hypothetical protein
MRSPAASIRLLNYLFLSTSYPVPFDYSSILCTSESDPSAELREFWCLGPPAPAAPVPARRARLTLRVKFCQPEPFKTPTPSLVQPAFRPAARQPPPAGKQLCGGRAAAPGPAGRACAQGARPASSRSRRRC